ncbi:MAG TPA: hypothetical protein VEC12_08765 [Bacteroidia bacterium]|nr:hypothetical protein [Bacteroidia bacterium]
MLKRKEIYLVAQTFLTLILDENNRDDGKKADSSVLSFRNPANRILLLNNSSGAMLIITINY